MQTQLSSLPFISAVMVRTSTTDTLTPLYKSQLMRIKMEASLRKAAFLSIAMTTAALAVSLIGIPLFVTFAIKIQSQIESESEFCRLKTRDLWTSVASSSMMHVFLRDFVDRDGVEETRNSRSVDPVGDFSKPPKLWNFGRGFFEHNGKPLSSSRGEALSSSEAAEAIPVSTEYEVSSESTKDESSKTSGFNSWQSSVTPQYISRPSYSTTTRQPCCCQGPPGPPGQAGEDGIDGLDGLAGQAGGNGIPGSQKKPVEHHCYRPCPAGPSGTPGPPGRKGPKGPKGEAGPNGDSPYKSPPGLPGLPGPKGYSGKIGLPGTPGLPGKIIITAGKLTGPPGPPGSAGYPGPKGARGKPGVVGHYSPAGPPGDHGSKGTPGKPGAVGYPGEPGYPGPPGSCDHCPQPKVPSGYFIRAW